MRNTRERKMGPTEQGLKAQAKASEIDPAGPRSQQKERVILVKAPGRQTSGMAQNN